MDITKPGNDASIYGGEHHAKGASALSNQTQSQINGPATTTSKSLLPGRGRSSFTTSIVRKDHVDLILFACALCSGLIDGSMIVAYTTFVSMQTGNTVFLALAISKQGPLPEVWYRPFLAVICFILGALFFSRLYLFLGSPRRRLTLFLTFGVQTICVFIAAIITQSGAVNSDVPPTVAQGLYSLALAPICLLAFQSAGQITTSRALDLGELPTIVVTSLLCDLFSDPHVFTVTRPNIKRNRRVAGFLLTFIGAIIAGWMGKKLGSITPALWLVVALKACMTISWMIWPVEKVGSKISV